MTFAGAGRRAIACIVAVTALVGRGPHEPGRAAERQTPLRDGTPAPVAGYRVRHSYPHDRNAFTQGLEFVDGYLYEGTGLSGRSEIRQVELTTGKVVRRRALAREHFGEGITVWKSRLFELTWQSHVAFVFDSKSFEPRQSYRYAGEGWGLTHDAGGLIMSDGTADLRFLDPETFAERRRVTVRDGGQPIVDVNELEYVKGHVLANVWTTNRIARIDPGTGRVLGWIDLAGLLGSERVSGDAVLNGIAYDEAHDRLFVTGKLWPTLFEIAIVPRG